MNILQESVGGNVSQEILSNEAWNCSTKCDELLKEAAQESASVPIKTGCISGECMLAKQKFLSLVYGEWCNVIVCDTEEVRQD